MRGKAKSGDCDRIEGRITPAYAGKRYIFKGLLCGFKDHPRLCGEKGECIMSIDFKKGSPPPMRGKAQDREAACGGRRDHPRLCGEKLFFEPRFHTRIGSPPPMRGKVPPQITGKILFRITPAYAGKSIENELFAGNKQDHPRLCGEKVPVPHTHILYRGSPPPMRGKA